MGSGDISLVSFNHDSDVDYGGRVPFGRSDNPAHGFVWRAVARLGLGPGSNPLRGLVEPGTRSSSSRT